MLHRIPGYVQKIGNAARRNIASAAQLRALTSGYALDTSGLTSALAYVAGGNVTGNFTPDFTQFVNISYTLTGNAVLQFPTVSLVPVIGRSGIIEIVEDTTGGRTFGCAAGYLYSGGTAVSIDTAASRTNGLMYHIRSATQIWIGLPFGGVR